MLEDKTDVDKAPKPSLGSPQSSILQFFTSPKQAISKKDPKPEESSTDKSQTKDKNDKETTNIEILESDASQDDSVILLSEDSSSLPACKDAEVDLDVSGLSQRTRKRKPEGEANQEKDILELEEVIEVSGETAKIDGKSMDVITDINTGEKEDDKSENDHKPEGNAVETSETSANTDQKEGLCDDVERKEKKKRKRKSSETGERKRSKPEMKVDDVPCDLNCSTEMSYEAFIQSISTPSRDVMADDTPPDNQDVISDNTPPEKEALQNHLQEHEELAKEKLKTKSKKKTARTSLFSDEGKAKSDDKELAVSSIDEGEKTKKASILNFFSKVNTSVEKDHQVVTIMADIHKMPSKDVSSNVEVAPIFKPKPKVLSPKSPGLLELETNIEIIETEIVEDVPKKTKTKAKKKDKTEKADKNPKEDTAEDVKIEKVEAAPRAAEVDAFLKNSDSPAIPTKSAQATLSFTKAGLKTANMTSTPHNTRTRSEPTEEPKPRKSAKGKKKSKQTVDKSKEDKDDPVLVQETDAPKGQRSRRVRYQVSSLQFDDSRQTPIKMKIRLKKNTSSGEESDFTPKSCKVKGVKQKKAQKLLEKAKKVTKSKPSPKERKKRKPASVVSDDSVVDLDSSAEGGRRRSARIKVMSPPAPIVVDEEVEIEEVPEKKTKGKKGAKTPLKLKPKDSPAKARVKNSPMKVAKDSPRKAKIKNSPMKLAKNSPRKPKGNSKLAPIFMGKSSNEPSQPKEPEDPEKVRLRQAFLMSDVPEALKKKAIATSAVQNIISENIGLPTISHVQQKPTEVEGVWNLPSVKLPLRTCSIDVPCKPSWRDYTCHRVPPHLQTSLFQDFRCHASLDASVLDELLGEVESWAKGLSVRQMFTDMKQKLTEDLKAQGPGTTETVAQPEVVEEPEKKEGRGRKKKLSLNKEEVKVVTPPPEVKIGEMMWSERYQPGHSSEVIGHTAHIQRLKSWLLEWKHRTHKEARKMRLQMLKQTCPKSNIKGADEDNAWWGEDDSDFDMDSDDSEDEDDGLCNTMLISGPHGVGKTCTIYALAQELGYKVIEVNAASSRNGKKILSKLQEATQSHQVAASKDGGSSNMLSALSNTLSNSGLALDSPKSTKKEAKLPTAFTNLFNKAAGNKAKPVEVIDLDADEKKSDQKKSKRKRKRDKDEEKVEKSPKKAKKEKAKPAQALPVRDDTSQSGGLELSSTTLILFDEVEIYFDDDRGYLPAIQHFMTRTKIPIILTTTEPNFGSQLQARFESLVFKQPSLVTIASHLQTICLVESVRTCHSDMMNLVRFNGSDIRKCLLWLQYWLSSGGGSAKQHRAVKKAPRSVISVDDAQDSDSQGRTVDQDDDFVVKKTARKRRVLDEDDSSNSAVLPGGLSSSQAEVKSSHLPQVHFLQLEAMAGTSKPAQECLEQVISSYLKGTCDKHKALELQELCLNLYRMNLPVLSHNLLHLLPLSKTLLNTASKTQASTETSSLKRSRIRTDLFDDEASNESGQEVEEKKEETKEISSKEVKCLSYKCLEAFSDYYETVCSVDVIASRTEECLVSKCYSSHLALMDSNIGGTNSLADVDAPVMSLMEDAVVETQMISARKLYTRIEKMTESYRRVSNNNTLPEEVSLPVSAGRSAFSLMTSEPKLPSAARKAQENVTDCLPVATHCNQRLIHLDYLPSLRGICRSEQYRQIAKTKRRFQHYFDNIGLPLKETTLNVLSQTFN